MEIFVYLDTGDWFEFMGIQEDVLLRVQDLIEAAGTDFAFPSQTTYLSQDSGIDRERSKAAEAQVKAWRSKDKLPFPEFPPKGSPNDSSASDNENCDRDN